MKALLFLLTLLALQAIAETTPIDGYWETIDDVSGHPKGIVQIYTHDGVTDGKIVAGIPIASQPFHITCKNCPAPFTNAEIMGLQFLWGFQQQGNVWTSGHILDPDSGNIYHAKMTLNQDDQSLTVRGYVGIPLFGRSQTWHRLSDSAFDALLKQYPVHS